MSAAPADNLAVLPATFVMVFPATVDGEAVADQYALPVTLISLGLTDYQQADTTYLTGFTGTKTIRSSAVAAFLSPNTPSSGTPTNQTELLALATQFATDWYTAQQARLDLVLVGYPTWYFTGLDEAAEYRHDRTGGVEDDQLSLRIGRGPWLDPREGSYHLSSEGSDTGTGLTVEHDDLTKIITPDRVFQVHRPTYLLTGTSPLSNLFLDWGVNIQSVGAINFPGFEQRASRVDHIHKLILPPCADILNPDCNQLCYDIFDQQMWVWDCVLGIWVKFCPCESGSGSGSGTPCVPGTCSLCASAPKSYTLAIAGFGGPCVVFNGTWTLKNTSACTWSISTVVAGIAVGLTLTIAGDGTVSLSLVGVNALGVTVATATYAGSITLPDCCGAVSLAKVSCSCDVVSSCPFCTGPTPTTWQVVIAGFTGACAFFNGTWNLQNAGGHCEWYTGVQGQYRLIWAPASGIAGFTGWVLSLFHAANTTPPTCCRLVNYQTGGPLHIDCCSAQTVTLVTDLSGCGVSYPGTLTVTPTGPECESPPSTCPATITATPTCCDSGGGITTACCPGKTFPATLYATFANGSVTGSPSCDCLNGVTWALNWNGTAWDGSIATGACSGDTIRAVVECDLSGWLLNVSGTNCVFNEGPVTHDCDTVTFSTTLTVVSPTTCCVGTVELHVTT